jgi:homoserine kinase
VLAHPHVRIDTRDARRVLRADVSLRDHIKQSASLAGLVAGCYTNDYELIGESLRDVVIEPQRAPLIPGFAGAKKAALDAGALGASISGSGPTVFAWVTSKDAAERVRLALVRAFQEHGVAGVDSWISPVSMKGARVLR